MADRKPKASSPPVTDARTRKRLAYEAVAKALQELASEALLTEPPFEELQGAALRVRKVAINAVNQLTPTSGDAA